MEFKNDFSSDMTVLKKNWKKEIIIVMIFGFLFLSLIIIIILLSLSSKDNKDEKEELGIINCIYDIQSSSSEISILGDKFNDESKIDIFVDGEKIKYSKRYRFEKTKSYEIKYKLYKSILCSTCVRYDIPLLITGKKRYIPKY